MGSLRIDAALVLRYVPSPPRWVSTPMISSTFKAWRSDARLTPNSLASLRSGGNLEPGTTEPLEISFLMLAMSWAVTRESAGFGRLSGCLGGIDASHYRQVFKAGYENDQG